MKKEPLEIFPPPPGQKSNWQDSRATYVVDESEICFQREVVLGNKTSIGRDRVPNFFSYHSPVISLFLQQHKERRELKAAPLFYYI